MTSLRALWVLAPLVVALVTPASAAAAVLITSPADGATVPPTFTVEITYGEITECDTDGCTGVDPTSLDLNADGMFLASCNPATECTGGSATLEVSLAVGDHKLQALTFANFSGDSSAEITVHVEAPAGTDTGTDTDTTTGTGTDGGTSAGSTGDGGTSSGDSDKGGCGCRSGAPTGGALIAFGVLGVAAARRRRGHR